MIYRPGWYKNTNISSNALLLAVSEKRSSFTGTQMVSNGIK
jgi:hypothetical protein